MATIAAPAQAFKTLIIFDGTNGANPVGALVQDAEGNLYGTTSAGGKNNDGTVFKITPDGRLITLHNFDGTDGSTPDGTLVQATDGDFYGTTRWGGNLTECYEIRGCGTVFKITPHGTLTSLYSFAGSPTDGSQPIGGLVHGSDGNFYGTTLYGGAGGCFTESVEGCGSVFKITAEGSLTILHSFEGTEMSLGTYPYAPLIETADGDFYGTTSQAISSYASGTVYRVTKAGRLTTLHTFCQQMYCDDGQNPYGWLVQDAYGNLFGTTANGGYATNCPYYGNCGAVFKLTTGGKESVFYRFCSRKNCADGYYPFAGLIQDARGNLYGTTLQGGAHCEGSQNVGCGTVFKLTTKGEETVLHSFCGETSCADGKLPYGGLMQDTHGKLYGTTYTGGDEKPCHGGCGTVFEVSP